MCFFGFVDCNFATNTYCNDNFKLVSPRMNSFFYHFVNRRRFFSQFYNHSTRRPLKRFGKRERNKFKV